MQFFRELNDSESSRCVIAEYFIESYPQRGSLRDACWALAIGQSVGNPNIRNRWETNEIFEMSSCVIYAEEKYLSSLCSGTVKIGFPVINTDWDNDGISHLLCQVMGGQLDIDIFKTCRLISLVFPDTVTNKFRRPKYGITGIRDYLNQQNKPISGSIVKPKTGISPAILVDMVKELLDGGVDFIKEDEILSNPSFCPLEARVEPISNLIASCGRSVIYSFCINGDHHSVLDRARFVSENGGNGVHINFWSGLGVYNSVRRLDLPLFMHYQKSGDKILTDKRHNFSISWSVLCLLAALCGVDTIHAGMWGGYLSDSEDELSNVLSILRRNNVLPALSCGMHPGIVADTTDRFGPDYLANCGGAIHGHPGGTVSGARAMRQAIDQLPGKELYEAVKKWGYGVDGRSMPEWILDF